MWEALGGLLDPHHLFTWCCDDDSEKLQDSFFLVYGVGVGVFQAEKKKKKEQGSPSAPPYLFFFVCVVGV